MAQLGKYKVPRELQDEDKWFKYFTKKQLATAIVILFIDWKVITLFAKLHLVIIGITLAILLTIAVGVIVTFKMPTGRHLYGGGVGLDVLTLRVFHRKLNKKNQVIFSSVMKDEEA